jgi:AcrR family transcriptional regulator
MSPRGATTTQDRAADRAEQLLEAAATLFYQKGYHATTIEDIGASLGITGPALYRYYKRGKPQLLTTLFEGTMQYLIDTSSGLEAEARSGAEALQALVNFHVDYVMANRARMRIIPTEVKSLPDEARARFRAAQAQYAQAWANTLRRARQDLSNNEAITIATGVLALINQFPRRQNELEDDKLRSLVVSMALAALHVPVDAEHPHVTVQASSAQAGRPRRRRAAAGGQGRSAPTGKPGGSALERPAPVDGHGDEH